MRRFSSGHQAKYFGRRLFPEHWYLQGNLFRKKKDKKTGIWRWIKVTGTGLSDDDGVEVNLEKESLDLVLDIVRERFYSRSARQFSVAGDESNFLPLTSLEIGAEKSRAICRIARYFSLESLGNLIDDLESPYNRDNYSSEEVITEILTIPQQIADEIFQARDAYQPGIDHPLKALRSINERQLAQINPIPIGTGFLVGGSHLMTNNHVISDPSEAVECIAQFNYEKDRSGILEQTVDYELDPNLLFVTDPALDYTLVQLKSGQFTRPAGYTFGWLQLVADESNIVSEIPINEAYKELSFLKEIRHKIQDILEEPNGNFQKIQEFIKSLKSLNRSDLWDKNSNFHGSSKVIPDLFKKLMEEIGKIQEYVRTREVILVSNEEIQAAIDLSSQINEAIDSLARKDPNHISEKDISDSALNVDKLLNDLHRHLGKLKIEDKTIEKIRETWEIKKILEAKKDANSSIPGDRVLLVQHPKGREKQLVQNDNRVLAYNHDGLMKNYLRYTAVSDYGSSGSPVFNTNWELVALHHAAIAKEETLPEKNATSEAKDSPQEGTSASTPPPSTPDEAAATADDQSEKPTIEASQGVRICRIVEDLQAKSWSLPKVKSFIEDFVVTAENLNNTALPGALNFLGGNKYIILDSSVGLLTASVDGTVKLWNPSGIELKTLSLGSQETTAKIEHMSFNAAGTLLAVARSPQPGQRGQIELWQFQGETLDSMQLVKNHDLTSNHPVRDDKAAIGSLCFGEDFFGQGEAILALSTDGYLDIWRATDGTRLRPPLDVAAQEVALLPPRAELEQQITALNQRLDGLRQEMRGWISNWQIEQGIKETEAQQANLQADVDLLNGITNGTNVRYTLANPLLVYDAQHSLLLYSARNSLLVLQHLDAGTPQQIKVSGITAVSVSPDGQEIALSASNGSIEEGINNGITFWELNGTRKPRWLPSRQDQGLVYGIDGKRLMALASSEVWFWENISVESSWDSYPAPYRLNLVPPETLVQITNSVVSANRNFIVLTLSDGSICLCRYDDIWRTTRLKTLIHKGAVTSLYNPTALGNVGKNAFSFVEDGTNYTLEMWVKPHLNASGSILAKGSRIGREYEVSVTNGRFRVDIGSRPFDGGAYRYDRFTHLAVVVRNAQNLIVEIYQDSELVQPEVQYATYRNPPNLLPSEIAKTRLLIGGSNIVDYPQEQIWTSDQAIFAEMPSFAGLISEVRIWNVARSQEQIKLFSGQRLNSAQPQGLVGYWRFEEMNNQRIKNLASQGNYGLIGAYGLIVGADIAPQTEIATRLTTSLEFSQPTSRVLCGPYDNLATPTALTAEAWVKHRYGNGVIIGCIPPEKLSRIDRPGYALIWQENKIRVILQGQGGATTIVDTRQNVPSDRAFHHIAFSWSQDTREIAIYVDGRRQDTVSVRGNYKTILVSDQYRSIGLFNDTLSGVTDPIYLGSSTSQRTYHRWVLAEVRLWSVARNQNQIQAAMAHHLPQMELGLVGYWRLDDGGKMAHNQVALWDKRTGPEHHGRVQGAQWFPAKNSGSVAGDEEGAEDNDDSSHRLPDPTSKSSGEPQLPRVEPPAFAEESSVEESEATDSNSQDSFTEDSSVKESESTDSRAQNSVEDSSVKESESTNSSPQNLVEESSTEESESTDSGSQNLSTEDLSTKESESTDSSPQDLVEGASVEESESTDSSSQDSWKDSSTAHTGVVDSGSKDSSSGNLGFQRPGPELTDQDNPKEENVSSTDGDGEEPDTSTEIQDIQGHWAQPFIKAVLDRQVMTLDGEGIFRPNDGVTLGDYVTAIAAAFDQPIQFDAESFLGWPNTDPYYPYAQKAYQMGFLPSSPDDVFDPDQWMNQVDVLRSLVQGLGFKGGTLNLLRGYADTAPLKLTWRLALATALRQGLVLQPDEENRLEPGRLITRAQLAALIYQSWVKIGQGEAISSAISSDYFVQLQEPPALFVDVPANHWARSSIQGLVDRGITHGYNDSTFRPDLRLSRGDFAVLLVRAFDPPPCPERQQANVSQLFVDVAANDPQTKFIQQIYRSGIMSGLPDRQFGAKAVISRAEAITALVKILDLPANDESALRRYADQRDIPSWATGFIAVATVAGLIVDPNPGLIRAKTPITRAEVASLIYRGWLYQTQKP